MTPEKWVEYRVTHCQWQTNALVRALEERWEPAEAYASNYLVSQPILPLSAFRSLAEQCRRKFKEHRARKGEATHKGDSKRQDGGRGVNSGGGDGSGTVGCSGRESHDGKSTVTALHTLHRWPPRWVSIYGVKLSAQALK